MTILLNYFVGTFDTAYIPHKLLIIQGVHFETEDEANKLVNELKKQENTLYKVLTMNDILNYEASKCKPCTNKYFIGVFDTEFNPHKLLYVHGKHFETLDEANKFATEPYIFNKEFFVGKQKRLKVLSGQNLIDYNEYLYKDEETEFDTEKNKEITTNTEVITINCD